MTLNGWYESRSWVFQHVHLPLAPAFHQNTYESEFNALHMIVTYAASITLAILRDDFTRLDRQGLVAFLKSSQKEDGRFVPTSTEGCWTN